jgi:hypothetical protein
MNFKKTLLLTLVILCEQFCFGQKKLNHHCVGVYAKEEAKYFPKLKKYTGILSQKASNSRDAKGLKQGLWKLQVKENTHYGSYTCLDTVNHGGEIPFNRPVKIFAKGNFKNGIPAGVWLKYMDNFDRTYYEYFFFKNGTCVKHTYFDHHNCIYTTDSLNVNKRLTLAQ